MDLVRLILCLLPASRLKNRLLSLTPGWRVHPTAHVAPNLVWNVVEAEIGPESHIGFGNVFRELRAVRLTQKADIGQWNWFSAAARHVPDVEDADLRGELRMEEGSLITSRHYCDISGGMSLGRYSGIAGVRVSAMTHTYDIHDGGQKLAPIRLGDFVLVFTGSVLLPGATLGPKIVFTAGSTIGGTLDQPEMLYGGSPAKPLVPLTGAQFFERDKRAHHRVMPREQEEELLRNLKKAERAGLA